MLPYELSASEKASASMEDCVPEDEDGLSFLIGAQLCMCWHV